MRLLMVVVLVLIGLAVFQSNRNHCYWHGESQAADWVACLTRL
jgi:hypothetical protein